MDVRTKLVRISDDQIARSRKAAENKLLAIGLSKDEAASVMESVREIPAFKDTVRKFMEGIIRWAIEGQIDLSDFEDRLKINNLLKVLRGSPAFDFFNKNFESEFNGKPATLDEVAAAVRVNLYREPSQPLDSDHIYDVVEINGYDQLLDYKEFCDNWCILQSEDVYNNYTFDGRAKLYLCLRDDYQEVQPTPGDDFPKDDYGLSIIAVIVVNGEVVSTTSRWNEDFEADEFVTAKELESLLGYKLS